MLSVPPQWQASRLAWSRLIHPRPVLVTISDAAVSFCWRDGGQSMFRSVPWPEGACRDGSPTHREAIGELIADLLFDLDLPGAELVLSLPPAAAQWRVVDGLSADGFTTEASNRDLLGSVDVPFNLEESYLLTTAIQDSVAVAGIKRSLLRAWIDVVEIADLPLRRITWSLTDAHRALIKITQDWRGDLAWLLVHDGRMRLILMRDRTPEVDYIVSTIDFESCCAEARACLLAWQKTLNVTSPLGWWFTLDHAPDCDWHQIVDAAAGEQILNKPLPWTPEPWAEPSDENGVGPLAHLAWMALHEEESW